MRIIPRHGTAYSAPRDYLAKLGLFQARPELLERGEYRVQSDVDSAIVDTFLAKLYGDEARATLTTHNAEGLHALCDEFRFTGFDEDFEAFDSRTGSNLRDTVRTVIERVDIHETRLEEMQRQILALQRQLNVALSGIQSELSVKIGAAASANKRTIAQTVRKWQETAKEEKKEQERVSQEIVQLKAKEEEFRTELKNIQNKVVTSAEGCDYKVFDYSPMLPQHGIIANLTGIYGGNVHELGIVEVMASSGSDPKNAVELETDWVFCSANEPNSWICYDFKGARVSPTSYSIRSGSLGPGSCNPRSWVLEVSNNGIWWDVADQRDDNNSLNDVHVIKNFRVTRQVRSSRYIRLRMSGVNHRGTDGFVISALEIFGGLSYQ